MTVSASTDGVDVTVFWSSGFASDRWKIKLGRKNFFAISLVPYILQNTAKISTPWTTTHTYVYSPKLKCKKKYRTKVFGQKYKYFTVVYWILVWDKWWKPPRWVRKTIEFRIKWGWKFLDHGTFQNPPAIPSLSPCPGNCLEGCMTNSIGPSNPAPVDNTVTIPDALPQSLLATDVANCSTKYGSHQYDQFWIDALISSLKPDEPSNYYFVNGIQSDVPKIAGQVNYLQDFFQLPLIKPIHNFKEPVWDEIEEDAIWYAYGNCDDIDLEGRLVGNGSQDYSAEVVAILAVLHAGRTGQRDLHFIAASGGTLATMVAIRCFSMMEGDTAAETLAIRTENRGYLANHVTFVTSGATIPPKSIPILKGLLRHVELHGSYFDPLSVLAMDLPRKKLKWFFRVPLKQGPTSSTNPVTVRKWIVRHIRYSILNMLILLGLAGTTIAVGVATAPIGILLVIALVAAVLAITVFAVGVVWIVQFALSLSRHALHRQYMTTEWERHFRHGVPNW